MKHSNFKDLDLFILDGVEYRFASREPGGIVLTGTAPPHVPRSNSFNELEEMLRLPGFRYIPNGVPRSSAESDLDGLPEHIRDLPLDKQEVALWRHAFAEELLCYLDAGLAKRSEESTALVLPAIIAAVEARFRQRISSLRKRAGRIEISRTPPRAHTLLNWTRRYQKAGFNIMALVPQTHRCGDHRSWMEAGELEAFDQLIAEYASPLRPTIDRIHERATNLYADFNSARAERGLDKLRVPSRSTVYRAIKRMDPYTTYLQRYGVDAANKNFL